MKEFFKTNDNIPMLPPLDARIPKWSLTRLVFRNCPLCSENNQPLLQRPDGLPISFCNDCYLWYVSSLPPVEEIHQLYQGYWFSFRPRDLSASYATSLLSDVESSKRDMRLNRLAALAGGLEGKRLLEIGCGCGELLTRARMRGASVFGNDISRESCEFVQEKLHIPVLKGEIHQETLQNEFRNMDIIVMSDLIEHLTDPLTTLHSALNILNPGGLLLIVTPNGGAASDDVESAAKWVGFRVDLEHLQYVSARTILVLANRNYCGIEHLEIYGYPALEGIDVFPAQEHEAAANRSLKENIKGELKKSKWLRSIVQAVRANRNPAPDRRNDPSCGTYHLLTIIRTRAS
jgi:2-polyprenyl-3-methyl-5-hydroxy-6-metoxy-1,4-benzoquinol methylase